MKSILPSHVRRQPNAVFPANHGGPENVADILELVRRVRALASVQSEAEKRRMLVVATDLEDLVRKRTRWVRHIA